MGTASMRRDMHKVVFERAKAGRTWASKTPRATALRIDGAGDQVDEESNHIRRKRQKHRNEHYGPLLHFLIRNIGRPWNHVYSEICAATDSRSRLQSGIRKYVDHVLACGCKRLYVHPRTGILLRRRERR
jgi:hypothetical protein